MPYTIEDLDNAIANSVGPGWWAGNGPSNPGFSRVLAIREAAQARWFGQKPDDEEATIIREAWADLCSDGYFRFVEPDEEDL